MLLEAHGTRPSDGSLAAIHLYEKCNCKGRELRQRLTGRRTDQWKNDFAFFGKLSLSDCSGASKNKEGLRRRTSLSQFRIHCQRLVHHLHPVFDRRLSSRLQMLDTADVRREDRVRMQRRERVEFAIAKSVGEIGLQQRIRAGGATAKVMVWCWSSHYKPKRGQLRLDVAAQALAMLQSARRMKCQQIRRTMSHLAL